MAEIRIPSQQKQISYEPDPSEPGQSLMAILLEAGIFLNNPCNGKETCGKCKVRILKGNVPPLTEAEKGLLRQEEQERGIRLSCTLFPKDNMVLEPVHREKEHRILTQGVIPDFSFCPERGSNGQPGTPAYGIAVDIGTTTVAASMIEMPSGKEVAGTARINAQKKYGLDVLTRITYEIENPQKGTKDLQSAIVASLDDMIVDMCRQQDINSSQICEIVISANCAMLHMFLGIDAVPLGRAPYLPVFTESQYVKPEEIGLTAASNAVLYLLPSVSGYIGADLVAGAHVCGLKSIKGRVFFLDIGTNGEMILAHDGKLLSCSCAAGPALEGMNISCGMRAAQGAAEDILIEENKAEIKVIGGGKAEGFCGSGILAAVREFIKLGLIGKNGTIIKKEKLSPKDFRSQFIRQKGTKRELFLSENLVLTQKDIRQVQLAKGAILSGFYALLDQAGLTMENLDRILVAGQFGAHLPAQSLTGVGILPEHTEDKLVYVGNTSKTGAYMALMSGKEKRAMEKLAKEISYIELSQFPGYERLFSKCLQFPG